MEKTYISEPLAKPAATTAVPVIVIMTRSTMIAVTFATFSPERFLV